MVEFVGCEGPSNQTTEWNYSEQVDHTKVEGVWKCKGPGTTLAHNICVSCNILRMSNTLENVKKKSPFQFIWITSPCKFNQSTLFTDPPNLLPFPLLSDSSPRFNNHRRLRSHHPILGRPAGNLLATLNTTNHKLIRLPFRRIKVFGGFGESKCPHFRYWRDAGYFGSCFHNVAWFLRFHRQHSTQNIIQSHAGNVTSAGFPASGHWMFTASSDGIIRIWDFPVEVSKGILE